MTSIERLPSKLLEPLKSKLKQTKLNNQVHGHKSEGAESHVQSMNRTAMQHI
ncbi:hypothetical protein SAMN04488056_11173 [Cohaesibacter marisflavi]|uniref:Uncharacterized protein n=1 Tax=Cohaesibacter marisflavi TaxID=655353 RepID=A0A1I5JBW3_9HYPH|nr:hypothetical protein SAMN04488056_11173 [Cohaesibacter marisflavi]